MEHEIKILLKYRTQDDDSSAQPTGSSASNISHLNLLTSFQTTVYLDNQPVGQLQKLKLSVDGNKLFPKLELTFPDYQTIEYPYPGTILEQELPEIVKPLSKVNNISIKYKNLNKNNSRTIPIQEIGTRGTIELLNLDKLNSHKC